MEFPLVSIIIPTYNQKPEYLRECIKSAINQTYKNIEIVISDNLSTFPHVQQVISEFVIDKRVTVVQPYTHLSMIDNGCFVADQAKGEYISFLSSDDLLEPNAIELLFNALLKNPGSKMAFGEVEHVDASSLNHIKYARDFELEEKNYSAKDFLEHYAKKKDGIWILGSLIERKEYKAIGGFKSEDIYTYHDIAFLFKWLNKKNSIVYVNKLTGRFRVWKNVHQKADGNRDKIDALDTFRIYDIMLASEYLASVIGKEKIVEWKHKHIVTLARYWSIMYIRGETNPIDFVEIKTMIFNTYSNFSIKFYFFCCNTPIKQLVYLIIVSKNHLKNLLSK